MGRPAGGVLGVKLSPTTAAASGVWTLREAQEYIKAGTWPKPAAKDPYFSDVSLLVHADGSGATFTDFSSSPKTITANGNATQSATQSKFGGKSAYFDGTGDYLEIANNDAFKFGSGDFVVEFWMYASSQTIAPICHQTSLSGTAGWVLWNYDNVSTTNSTRKLTLMLNGADFILVTSANAYADNTWTHIAVVRNGSSVKIYSGGSEAASGTFSGAITSASTPFQVGGIISGTSWNGTFYFTGYIDDLRITKGSNRGFVSSVTVPDAAFPDA